MINLKEHFKLTAVYTFFAVFPALLQLIVYPVIEGKDRLGAEDFGYLAITEAIITAVFIICLFGTGNGIARLYYDNKENIKDYNNLVSTVLNGILARGMLLIGISVIVSPFAGNFFPHEAMQNFNEYGPALFISGVCRAIIVVAVTLYRHERRLALFIIISVIAGLLKASMQVYTVLVHNLSFVGYVHGTAIGSGVTAIIIIFLIYKSCGLHFNKKINLSLYKFSSPLFFSDIIFWGLLFADRFFLLNKPEELGIYDNALKFAIGVQLIIQGLSSAIQPEIFRFLKEGIKTKEKEIKQLSNIFMLESLFIITVAIIPAMLFISIFYETSLTASAGLVAIVFVRFILRAQYLVFSWPIMFSKNTKLFFTLNLMVLIICLFFNWLLTPKIGYYGAIISFFIAFIFQVFAFKIAQNKTIPIKWNYKKILYFPLIIVLTAAILEILKLSININPYFTSIILIVVVFSGIFLLYKSEINNFLKGKLHSDKHNRK